MVSSKFQTIVDVPGFKNKTGYSKSNVFVGSCFTENVGNRMKNLKYKVDINPFGILFNPLSVANALRFLLAKKKFDESDLTENNALWHSFYHHGRFSNTNKSEAINKINERVDYSSEFLENADFLFLTFGTAWVYKLKTTDLVVANCHKFPENTFYRARLSVIEIVEEYKLLLKQLWSFNPKLKIVFTVSPVRHWKDGAVENQRSKATLLLAIDQIVKEIGDEKCNYFPAYEVVMDELRDYRFYAEDMVHISDVAVNHIWQIFEKTLIEDEDLFVSSQVQKILKVVGHKPINKFSKHHLAFLEKYRSKSIALEAKYSYLNFKLEKEYFNTEIEEIKNVLE